MKSYSIRTPAEREALADAFQTLTEGYAVACVSNPEELKRFVTKILETQLLPIVIDVDAPELILNQTVDGQPLGRIACSLIESLAWRVWQWVYWWQNPLGDAKAAYVNEWSEIGPKLELIAACLSSVLGVLVDFVWKKFSIDRQNPPSERVWIN